MNMDSLQDVVLAIAQQRSVSAVLQQIVEQIADYPLKGSDHPKASAARKPAPGGVDIALVRIWLVSSGDICHECRFRTECPDQTKCLHLVASAGQSMENGKSWSRLDGQFRRFPVSVRKIGHIAATGKPIFLPDIGADSQWVARPEWVKAESITSFAGCPMVFRGETLGVLGVFSRTPFSEGDFRQLQSFADHAAVAIANARAFEEIEYLQARLEEENDQLREEFRDLFEEAPIPYVYEGLDSRFIRANRAALETLGIQPEEIPVTFGKSFVPDTPEAQRLLREALEAIGRGESPGGVVLEMRRKDNGNPLWVQWWSKPARDGKSTRTMLVDITDRVLLEREQSRLQAQNEYLLEEIRTVQNYGNLIGESSALRKVQQKIELVAPTPATVLITGESGTGKELVARAIHEHSPRSHRPMITVNCGAVPETLFESEFFGHAKGAFTGALHDKAGRFELADGGTLFLDEIGEVPLAMQAKLLRVLQEQEIERVGDPRVRKINVRIIAATNRDLKAEVEAGHFRQDLYYRLSVFPIENPPLRQRREDIPLLAEHFIRAAAHRMNCRVPKLTEASARELAAHDWPGNVRELQNAIERAVILAQGGALNFDPPAASGQLAVPAPRTADASQVLTRLELKQSERESIAAALAQTGGKIFGPDGAAALLGMKPTTLASRIKALGLLRKPTYTRLPP